MNQVTPGSGANRFSIPALSSIRMKGNRQLLRLDAGPLNKKHAINTGGLKSSEIDIIKSPLFHLHINKWLSAI